MREADGLTIHMGQDEIRPYDEDLTYLAKIIVVLPIHYPPDHCRTAVGSKGLRMIKDTNSGRISLPFLQDFQYTVTRLYHQPQ